MTQDVLVNYGLLDVLIDMLQMDERGKNGVSTCIFSDVTTSPVDKRSKTLRNDPLCVGPSFEENRMNMNNACLL